MTKDLGRRTIHGVRFTLLATIVNGVLQTGFLIVLARLLKPIDYGLVAIGMVVITSVNSVLFSGLERAVVLTSDLSGKQAGSIMGFNTLLGFGAAIAVGILGFGALGTDKFAIYAPILFALSPLMSLSGIAVSARARLRQQLCYRELAIADMISQLLANLATLVTALWGWGPYSIVCGYTVRAVVQTAMNIHNSGLRLAMGFSLAEIRPVISTSFAISKTSVFELLRSNLPTLFIGGFAGPVALGFYNRGFLLVEIPSELLLTAMSSVLFSTFSLIRDDHERLMRACRSLVEIGSGISVPLCLGMAAAAPELVRCMLGSQWMPVIGFIPIVCIAVMMRMLAMLLSVMTEATARFDERFVVQVTATAITAFALLFASRPYTYGTWGLAGYCIAVLIGNLIPFAGQTLISTWVIKISPIRILGWIAPSAISGIVLAALVLLVRFEMRGIASVRILFVEIATCAVGLSVLYGVFWRDTLLDVVRYAGIRLPARLLRSGSR